MRNPLTCHMLTDINGSIVSVLWDRAGDENTHGSLDPSPVHGEGSLGSSFWGWNGSAIKIWGVFKHTGRCQVG